MSTERLTPDQALRKWCEITYPELPMHARAALQNAMIQFAAQEVEHKTKQLMDTLKEVIYWISGEPDESNVSKALLVAKQAVKGEPCSEIREKYSVLIERLFIAKDILDSVNSGLNIVNTLTPCGPTHMRIKEFLKQLNQQNEG